MDEQGVVISDPNWHFYWFPLVALRARYFSAVNENLCC
jgi:hypothetical protein